jgi:MYXO-CTERM domain-containing protein
VTVTNPGPTAQRLRISVSTGVTAANSGAAYKTNPGYCSGVSCWVTGLPAAVTLAPGERKALRFRVSVPDDVPPAQYLTGITAEHFARPAAVTVGSNGKSSARAIVIRQVTVGVAVTTGALARMRSDLAVWKVSAGWAGRTPRLFVPVYNSGQTFAKATGTVTCDGPRRPRSFDLVMGTVLPSTGAVLPVNAHGLAAGSLTCAVRLRDATGRTTGWSGEVELPPMTQKKTVRTGEGAYTTLPIDDVPPWTIVLVIIGVLTLAALLALLALQRRHRRHTG